MWWWWCAGLMNKHFWLPWNCRLTVQLMFIITPLCFEISSSKYLLHLFHYVYMNDLKTHHRNISFTLQNLSDYLSSNFWAGVHLHYIQYIHVKDTWSSTSPTSESTPEVQSTSFGWKLCSSSSFSSNLIKPRFKCFQYKEKEDWREIQYWWDRLLMFLSKEIILSPRYNKCLLNLFN